MKHTKSVRIGSLLLAAIALSRCASADPRFCTAEETAALDSDGSSTKFTTSFGPYLQNVTDHSALVEWNSADATSATTLTVSWEGKSIAQTVEARKGRSVVGLCDLNSSTTYQYSTGGSATNAFRTLSLVGSSSLRFAAVGDIGSKGDPVNDVVREITSFDPELVVIAGDVVYESGAYSEYPANFIEPIGSLLSTRALFPVLGNHDVRSENGAAYLDFFDLPVNSTTKNERYYSFDAGPVHFAMTDSASDSSLKTIGSKQALWLESDLAKSRQKWKIVVLHHPPYSSGESHGSDLAIRALLEDVFKRQPVDLVITGHDHVYERTHPQKGVVYVVTGGGGKSVRPVIEGKEFSAKAVGKRYHFIGFDVSADSILLRAIDRYGEIFDRSVIRKPELPSATPSSGGSRRSEKDRGEPPRAGTKTK